LKEGTLFYHVEKAHPKDHERKNHGTDGSHYAAHHHSDYNCLFLSFPVLLKKKPDPVCGIQPSGRKQQH